MKKLLILLSLMVFLFFKAAVCVSADYLVAGESASLIQSSDNSNYQVEVLRKFLVNNNSPLAPYAEEFVKKAQENNLDWRLIPAITGVESTYGKHIPLNSFNAYGWANGKYSFNSWEQSIAIVAQTLKNKYVDRGYISINQIARIYAPPSSTWASKVKFIMNKIDPLPLEYTL